MLINLIPAIKKFKIQIQYLEINRLQIENFKVEIST